MLPLVGAHKRIVRLGPGYDNQAELTDNMSTLRA